MGPDEDLWGNPLVIQFCDRNADDLSSFLDGDDSQRMDPIRLMDPIQRLRELTAATPGSHRKSDDAAPPTRVWSSIEDALRSEGLISE